MSPLENLGFILGTSFASGLNLYATVGTAGLLQRFGVVDLPPALEVLAHPLVLGLALTLVVVEFLADKIPVIDSVWDAVHTVIRPLGGALVLSGVDDASVGELTLAASGGLLALSAHAAKASIRALVNLSPEPFSNAIVSVSEDGLVATLMAFRFDLEGRVGDAVPLVQHRPRLVEHGVTVGRSVHAQVR